MKRTVIGILAHVDSGKTTLSEGLLYNAGAIGRLGRVDHGDAFLDTNEIERDRGITIFSKQAMLNLPDSEITLLDTPGHVDFSAEAERTLRVLDFAVLVIGGQVQSHTETLWKLLDYYNVPTFVFVNKMDLPSSDKAEILKELHTRFGDGCVDFTDASYAEEAAMCDDSLFEEYDNTGDISDESVISSVISRKLFPCFFGSALRNEGVKEFLEALDRFTAERNTGADFGARVFKISEDEKGQRLTHMRITGGSLKVKTMLPEINEKINEVRIYSGAGFISSQEVFAGNVCAVTGLTKTFPGQGLGTEKNLGELQSEPVFTYSVKLPPEWELRTALPIFRKLEEEETQMHVTLNEYLQKIDVQVMGEIQLEVLKRILEDRFSMNVEFEDGSIIYKETISGRVEGVGHYEPLRHYAEVHLILEPGKPGSGVVFDTKCSEDILDRNWQRLILTHLAEKEHSGVLTGSPITDIKITLINGRAHQKHTEGGDFRQATYRAVRHGLMKAENILLEPWYSFSLEIPMEATGRAMTDLQQMGAVFDAPDTKDEYSVITGKAPVSQIRSYQKEIISYSKGKGRLSCSFCGYEPCPDSQKIIEEINYNPESDVENTPDSVFCSHGSGFVVKWNQVHDYMHIPLQKTVEDGAPAPIKTREARKLIADEEELLRIFEQTYGKVKTKSPRPMKTRKAPSVKTKSKPLPTGPSYLLIDGYNIIYAWEELSAMAEDNPDDARELLINRICNYQALKQNNVILVFDAYKVKGGRRSIEKHHGITVVYTEEAETADSYIEKATHELCKNYRVRVATSDRLEQIIIFGHGAYRISASEFLHEVKEAEEEMREIISLNNKNNL